MRIKARPISGGTAEGEIVFYNPRKKVKEYKNKIVVLENLTSIKRTFRARKARGFVAEKGAITSHGAILLRELRIPGIVFPGAKKVLKENLWAEIDGFRGYIDTRLRVRFHIPYRKFRPTKKGPWLLFRPRQNSRLKISLSKKGIEITPQVLLNSKRKGGFKQTKAGYWVKNYPTPKVLVKKIIKDDKWFKQRLKERKRIFYGLKEHLKFLTNALRKRVLDIEDHLDWLKLIRGWFTVLRPYNDLTHLSVDQAEEECHKFLASFLPPTLVMELLSILVRSSYADKIIKTGKLPPKRIHDFEFPAPPLSYGFIEIKPKYYFSVKIDLKVKRILKKQSHKIQVQFQKYSQILPLLTELSEEATYIYWTLFASLNHIVERLAKYLVKKKKIKKVEDIVNFTVDQVIDMVKS